MAQAPLIGSRISLISKKDIRYEGILYTIYAHEHSVVLQNGACLNHATVRAHTPLCAHNPWWRGKQVARKAEFRAKTLGRTTDLFPWRTCRDALAHRRPPDRLLDGA